MLVLTATPEIARQCQGYLRNCECDVVSHNNSATDTITEAIQRAKLANLVRTGDFVVVIHGSANVSFISGSTRLMQIYTA